MEVPSLGVDLELQVLAYATAAATRLSRPGIEPETSWLLVGFITAEPQWELLEKISYSYACYFLFFSRDLSS